MSRVTQCPECSTHFRVVDDQLKISGGWVRCGVCGHVFDAQLHIQPWSPPDDVAAEPGPAVDIEIDMEPDVGLDQRPPQEQPEPLRASEPPPAFEPVPEPISVPPPGTAPKPVRVDAPPLDTPHADAVTLAAFDAAHAQRLGAGLDALEPMGIQPDPAPGTPRESEADAVAAAVPEPAIDADDTQHFSFVRQAQRRAAWRKPWVRVLGGLMASLLMLLLAGQVALHERHRWVALHPEWRPLLQHACEPLACTIEPFRQIESVLIDSSALVREQEGLFRLEVGMKNTSGLVLAMPALELSLTNTDDEVVLRRVLLPTDWDTPPDTLAPQATASLVVRLLLSDAAELRMEGYRALLFYP